MKTSALKFTQSLLTIVHVEMSTNVRCYNQSLWCSRQQKTDELRVSQPKLDVTATITALLHAQDFFIIIIFHFNLLIYGSHKLMGIAFHHARLN